MADITTVIADIQKAQDDAYATPEAVAANVGPSPAQQIATLTAANATLTTELATANGTIATLQAEIAKVKTDVAADLP